MAIFLEIEGRKSAENFRQLFATFFCQNFDEQFRQNFALRAFRIKGWHFTPLN